MKQHRLYVVALLLLNGACGQLPPQTDKLSTAQASAAPSTGYQIPSATRLEQQKHPFGSAQLSNVQQRDNYSDTMHLVLLAEFAKNKDDYKTASHYFYQAAEQSSKAELAEQAVNMALYAADKENSLKSAALYKRLSQDIDKAQQLFVIALFVNDKPSEALVELEQLLGRTSHVSDRNLDLLIKLLAQHPDKTAALDSIQRLIVKHPEDQALNYVYARLLLYLKRYEDSLPILKKIIKNDPEHEQALPLYLEVLQKLKRDDEAIRFMQTQLRKTPDNIEAQLQYAQLLIEAKQYKKADRHFKKFIKKQSNDSRITHALALLYLQYKQYNSAEYYFKQLLKQAKITSERESAYYFLGQVAEKQNKIDQALNYYQKITVGGQHYFSARLHQVLLFKQQGQTEKALDVLTETHPHSSEQDELLIKLEAEIYIETQAYQKALAVYRRGLKNQPDNLDLLYMQGMIAEQANELDLSEQSFRAVMAKDPKNVEAINALGYTLADRTDRYQEAYELIQRAYKLKPDAYYILDSMGWVLYHLEKYPESIDYFNQALAAKYDPEIAAHLGEVLWVSGDQNAALAIWEKAQDRFPTDERLQKTMQKFLK